MKKKKKRRRRVAKIDNICDIGGKEACLKDILPKGKAGSELDTFLLWGKFIAGVCFYLLYAMILAYLGVFNLIWLLIGFFLIFYVSGAFSSLSLLTKDFFSSFDFPKLFLVLSWMLWSLFLLIFFSYPYFEGRDEGSYANAAVYLAENGSMVFEHPILPYLKNEGLAHQALNFPGFVIKGDGLVSQFSPAYVVWLAIFFLMFGGTIGWWLANGFLILGGSTAFYFLLRLFLPRWVAISSIILLIFHFVFLWFPRFTLSENLAFFLFCNLLFFLILTYFNPSLFQKNRFIAAALILLIALLPLTRPEGWWLLLASLVILFIIFKKDILKTRRRVVKFSSAVLFGALMLIYAMYDQLPVYKRLFKDWIEWADNKDKYLSIGDVGDVGEIASFVLPSTNRLIYFWQIEWKYGVLLFGLLALLFFGICIAGRFKKSSFFPKEVVTMGIVTLFLSFPFFVAFVSPQISSDHPWLLRRFLFVVIPCGILGGVIFFSYLASKLKRDSSFILLSALLAILLVPSLQSTAYFLLLRDNDGRSAVLHQLGRQFDEDDWVLTHREASGDGWHMWSAPLSSVYQIPSVYVFNPNNVVDMKDVIYNRWGEGQKTYIILPEKAYDFRHALKKHFTLLLEREVSFINKELDVQKSSTGFPLLRKRSYSSQIYLLKPL